MKHSVLPWLLLAVLAACTGSNNPNSNNVAPEDSGIASVPELPLPQYGPPTPNKELKTPDCGSESKDPMCRPVLVGGEGNPIVIGTVELRGPFKMEYYPDGKIAKLLSFDPAHPDKPRRTKAWTYNTEGQIESVTVEEDENLLDPVLDMVEKLTFIYSSGKLETESGTKKKPSQPNLPMRIIQKKYQEMAPNVMGSVYTENDLNHIQIQEDTYQGKAGPWNYEMVKRSHWSASLQGLVLKIGEGRLNKWDAGTNSKLDMYTYCDDAFGVSTDCDPQGGNFTQQYSVTTFYQYQGSKLITTITGIDGDKNNLQNNIADGNKDRNIDCTISYDEANKFEPYPLPEEARKLGLSGKDVVKSIECTEGTTKSVYNFHYEPLWKVVETN